MGLIFRDPTNTENISVVVRFVKQEKLHEVLIDMTTSINRDADALTGRQSWRGRMVKNRKRFRSVLESKFVHCFNDKLHLVVVHAISDKELEKFLVLATCCICQSCSDGLSSIYNTPAQKEPCNSGIPPVIHEEH